MSAETHTDDDTIHAGGYPGRVRHSKNRRSINNHVVETGSQIFQQGFVLRPRQQFCGVLRATAAGDDEQIGNLSGLDGSLKLRSSSQNVHHTNLIFHPGQLVHLRSSQVALQQHGTLTGLCQRNSQIQCQSRLAITRRRAGD